MPDNVLILSFPLQETKLALILKFNPKRLNVLFLPFAEIVVQKRVDLEEETWIMNLKLFVVNSNCVRTSLGSSNVKHRLV